MTVSDEKTPQPEEVEREVSEFLTKRYGDRVKIVSPMALPQELSTETQKTPQKKARADFGLKPEELTAYLDQYIVKQDRAKAILATKICTHYHRVKQAEFQAESAPEMVGGVKNNVLMIGPTGVGKTYMIRLIAKKIGVPFVKGDATKFSETGYVGGDVEDLVRDLVREADEDLELAQHGIIYIDEIDKIASSTNLIGPDVSRTGVQRALLKPMEETDVDLKVPHDPVSMIQEIERFRRTGKRERKLVNTRNILFIMSGAFNELPGIIKKRIKDKGIGFGAPLAGPREERQWMAHVRAEDLIQYGFESEFVGRLPVIAVLDELEEEDLYEILKNPNNPITLAKKLDFAAYGIDIRFEDQALRVLARHAAAEKTGARGLVSAVERALLLFEKKLPSTTIRQFPVTEVVVEGPEKVLADLLASPSHPRWSQEFRRVVGEEKEWVKKYIQANQSLLAERFDLKLTPSRIDLIAVLYCSSATDIRSVLKKVRIDYGHIKKLEVRFFNVHDVNIVLEEDAIDHVIAKYKDSLGGPEDFYQELTEHFELGLKLIKEKTGRNLFFLTRQALEGPEAFLSDLIRRFLKDGGIDK